MKPMLRGIAVAVAAVGVVACAKQAWRVTYPGPEDFSQGTAVLVQENGTAYMAGILNEQSAFVAAYNASGKKLWERVIEGEGFARSNVGRTLERDSEGNLYLLQGVLSGPTVLIKLSPSGELLESNPLPDGNAITHFRMIDNVLYAGTYHAPRLNAYGLDGSLLWSYSSATGMGADDGELGQYPGGTVSVSAAASSNGYAALLGVTDVLEQDGRLYLPASDGLAELDHSGNEVLFRSAAELGLNAIYRVVENGNGLMVIGEYDGATYAVLLDLELSELSRSPIAASPNTGAIASSGEGVVCVGMSEADGSSFHLVQLDASGNTNWSHTIPQDGKSWEFVDVLADGDACYLSVQVHHTDNTVVLRTQRYDSAGAISDTFLLPDFGVLGMTVQGKGVYHVGMTGEYDGSSTIATLDKQSRK